jgi:hypothetical protein
LLTDETVRDRIWLALRANRPDFAGYLLRTYTPDRKTLGTLVDAIRRHPAGAGQMPALRTDTPRNRALLGVALTKLAGQDAVAARQQNFASVNGLVVQASNIGALLGPPLAAALVVSSGWRGVGPVYLMTAAVSALLIVLAARAPEMRPTASARRVHG